MANYYITGIKKDIKGNNTHISEVSLHVVEGSIVNAGHLVGKDRVIALIKAGHLVQTATWNYKGINWTTGESVSYETVNGVEYLRSTPDNERRDNLLHLLPLTNLGL